MQIELIGCTSSGKSTLTRGMLQASQEQGITILMADDFVLKQIHLDRIKGHLPRSALVNLVALFACLVTWRKNFEFYQFTMQHLRHLPIAWLEKLYLFRNVLKKIGIYEIIRFRNTSQQIILVDEGVLQIAHNLFVHVSENGQTDQLSNFARLVSLPDVIVYIRQSEAILVDRATKRGHKRVPDGSDGDMVYFIRQAISTFETLIQNPAVENRLLVFDTGQNVTTKANNQDDPFIQLALKIVRNGVTVSPTNLLPEAAPAH